MENNNKLQKLIQGGAVGICILLIALLWFILNNFFNHLTEGVKTQQDLVGMVERLDGTIERFDGTIEQLIDALNK